MNLPIKRLSLYIIVLVLIGLLIYYYFFLHPTLMETQSTLRDITVLQDNILAIKKKDVRIKNNRKNREQLQELLFEKQSILPEQLDSYEIICLLSEFNSTKINKRSIIFLEPIIKQDFHIIPVRFSLSTDNNSFLEFLVYLDELPYQTTISYMQISAIKFDESKQNLMEDNTETRYNLEVEMTLNFYVRGKKE